MNIEQIHPELREAIQRFPKMPMHNRFFVTLFKLLGKIVPGAKTGPGVAVEDRQLKHAGVRIYRPEGARCGAGLLWIHGGGLVVGGAKLDNRTCGALARDLGLVVVSVEYRLAPESKFPGAIDDCFEAWQWFQQQAATLGVDPTRIAVAGQSAGGGLAASLAVCQLHVTPGAPHGFEVLAPNAPVTRTMHLSAYQFLCKSLGLTFDPNNYSYGCVATSN